MPCVKYGSARILLQEVRIPDNNPEQTAEKVIVQPGEQAPPADPGQKNFGGSAVIPSQPRDTTGMSETGIFS